MWITTTAAPQRLAWAAPAAFAACSVELTEVRLDERPTGALRHAVLLGFAPPGARAPTRPANSPARTPHMPLGGVGPHEPLALGERRAHALGCARLAGAFG